MHTEWPASSGGPVVAALPARLPPALWLGTLAAFVGAHVLMFSVVHPYVDTRLCVARLQDPFFELVAYDRRWYFVTHQIYYVLTFTGIGAFVWQAVRGDHRPVMRFAAALSLQALLRCATLSLIPLCRATVTPGTAVLTEVPTVDLGFAQLPWLLWATNDLVFSGHVGEFLIMMWVGRSWPLPARLVLILFQILQAYGLIATRGHYAVDLLLALPCAYFADAMAQRLLVRVGTRRRRA